MTLVHARHRWDALAPVYAEGARTALADSILPFWCRTIDEEQGGVFNCWNNAGTRLVSRDKFTWSQGRFIWLWSRLAELSGRGTLTGDSSRFLAQAKRTVDFLQANAFLEDGRCAFLLSDTGDVKEMIPGAGLAPSIYADCFVVLGFAEFARVSGDRGIFQKAWSLFEHIEARIAAGGFPTFPEPIPEGYGSHAVAMIFLNLTVVLHTAAAGLGDDRLPVIAEKRRAAAARIFDHFMRPGGRIQELRPVNPKNEDTLLSRHVNPGHALEGLWMLLTVAQEEGRSDWIERANASVQFQLERGWDAEHGGILHYVDRDGGPPRGSAGSSDYERGVRDTWDTKLWWVHSEAIYATALSSRLTDDDSARGWFERIWEYAFRVFPHPNPTVGEWIQIRGRRGEPLERVVALPVKDPYHIARNLIQVLELFTQSPKASA